MRLPIPYTRHCIEDVDVQAVETVLRSDFVTQGPKVAAFEDALRERTGAGYVVAVSSGTAALHLACLGLGLGPGDVGIVPGITFAATANCLRLSGAGVTFCDVDPQSGKVRVGDIEAAFSRTESASESNVARAVIPVSYAGSVPDLPAISEVAKRKKAFVIEDAAHSLGAEYLAEGGRFRSGSCAHSDAAIFSFHPAKHICAGEGGAVLTNDSVLADRVRRLRSHGIERTDLWRYEQVELGLNYRMSDLQAALALSQLARLDSFLEARRRIADRYRKAFDKGRFATRMEIAQSDDLSAHHLFVVLFRNEAEREAAYLYLKEREIFAQVHYIPVYRHPYYKEENPGSLSGAEAFYERCLSLPMFSSLLPEEQDYVIDVLTHFFDERK